jgi:hypothetical protein
VNIRTEILLALPFVLVGCMESSPVPAALGSHTAAVEEDDLPELPYEDITTPDDDPPKDAVLQGATVEAFDRDQAAANGYEIRTLPDGREYSVPIRTPNDAIPDDINVVRGNCGTSWISEQGIGSRSVDLRTGFFVNKRAVAYGWQVRLRDPGGISGQHWGGPLWLRTSWAGRRVIHGLTQGVGDAQVVGGSYAVLVDGAVCVSLGPHAWTFIY